MPAGARTPEELETLLEDAFLLHDDVALVQLFEPDSRAHRGRRTGLCAWPPGDRPGRGPALGLRAHLRDAALVLGGGATSVIRRGGDGAWRYAISILDKSQTTLSWVGEHRPS